MPQVVIIAGPNGAGKTTFASNYLVGSRGHFSFVNADEIAREVARRGARRQQADMRAGRIMLERIDNLVVDRADFAFETTLATLSYAQKIRLWRRSDYVASLIYLHLPSIEASIERCGAEYWRAVTVSQKTSFAGASAKAPPTSRICTNPSSIGGIFSKATKANSSRLNRGTSDEAGIGNRGN